MAEFDRAALRKIFEGAEIEVPKDVLGQICDLHTSSMDGLPETIKELKGKLKVAEQERDAAKAKVPVDGEETISKAEYDKLKDEFDKYKGDIEAKETKAKVNNAVRSYLESKSITGDNLDLAMMACESIIARAELDGDKLKDTTALDTLVGSKFKRLVTHTETKGANTANPPANNGNSGVTKEDFQKMPYKDRLKIYNENPDLYNELTT